MAKTIRWIFRIIFLVGFLGLLAGFGGYMWLRTSLPQINGTMMLAGLSDEVEVIRDRHGIPHIYAKTDADAFFALGVVHAQDRLWQMELSRRTAAGRLSEVIGAETLGADTFLRTMGFAKAAAAGARSLDEQTRADLEAYAQGVNAFLANRKGALPPEFLVRSAGELEPWSVLDSLGWLKMMSYDLGGASGARELDRFALSQIVSHSAMMEFWPPYPGAQPLEIPDIPEFYGLEPNTGSTSDEQASAMLPSDELNWLHPAGVLFEGIGSNNWVLSGEHTVSGKPIVANDPHLGLQTPQIWYYAHLVSDEGLDVMGATFPGVPFVVLGRTDKVAWGFTNTGPDVQDYYIEKIAADEPRSYVTPTGIEPFKTRVEEIKVKGGETVRIKVRETRHGPVMSDVLSSVGRYLGEEFVLALRWTALDETDTTANAASKLNRAQSADEFLAASASFVSPQQNMVYADVEGNIGYVAPGRIPVRGEGNLTRGFVPAPGWEAAYDWQGYLSFEDLPQTHNPASGIVVTANEDVTHANLTDYPHFITAEWSLPYRGDRIRSLLAETAKHTLESVAAIQTDTRSTFAEALLPRLIDATDETAVNATILAELDLWNGFDTHVDQWEMTLFLTWIREINNRLYRDEWAQLRVGKDDGAARNTWAIKPELYQAMLDGRSTRWCGDAVADPEPKGVPACRALVTEAFNDAVKRLTKRLGRNHREWRWGAVHIATMSHTFESVGGLVRQFFQNDIPAPGGPYTVNVGGGSFSDDGEMMSMGSGASLRHIFDLGDLDNSRFITSNGQSGNPMSGLHDTFMDEWSRGEYFPLSSTRRDAEIGRTGKLLLQPN